jgi:ribonuclease G
MPKEMIVSVNGREKKIAIIENGRVTEFYIERGESTQGIVGNIYKGRVMRVLPGMQSAFVDIGLERDAFLYVSDFFDEEEEFERIVVDKKKTEGADDEAAQRAAAERIERARVERERRAEQAQAEAEPESDEEAPEPRAEAPGVEDEEEAPAAAAVAPRQQERPAQEEAGGRGGRRERGRRRRGGREGAEVSESAAGEVPPGASFPAEVEGARDFAREEITTPFVAGADSFERIVDEDESAAEFGETFKDARLQERLSDQTRAVEFDIEPTTGAEVGSLLGGGASAGGGFERIADDDDGAEQTHARLHSVQREVAAAVADFVGDAEAGDRFAAPQEFERVSDDEAAPAQRSSKKAAKGAAKSASKKGSKKAAAPRAESGGEEGEAAAPASKKGASKKAASKKGASKSGSKAAASKSSSKKGSKKAAGDSPAGEDAEASVTQRTPRGEFARRGGRRRRKPGSKPEGEQGDGNGGENGEAEVITDDAPAAEFEAAPEPEPAQVQQPAADPRPERPERRERGERGGRGRDRDRERPAGDFRNRHVA